MAAALPFILMGASTLFSAVGSISQGSAQGASADYNAAVARRNSNIAIQQGNFDAEQQHRKAIMTLGAARAQYGASGVTAEGSPLDVLATSAANAEMDNQTIKYRARLRALGYQDEAGLDSLSADNARSNGYSGALGALLGGGASLYTNGLLMAPDSGGSGVPEHNNQGA